MSRKIISVVIVLIVLAGIILSFYFYRASTGNNGNVREVAIEGLNSGTAELLNCNGKPHIIVWDSQAGAIYVIPLNSSLSTLNLSHYKPVLEDFKNMNAYADMTCHGETLYVAISSNDNNGTRSIIISVALNGNGERTISLQGKRVMRIFYWNGLWLEDWYGDEYHIEHLLNNGTVRTVYDFPMNVTPVQEDMVVYGNTLYWSFLLGHNSPHSTYEILAISNSTAKAIWKVTGNFEYGFSTMVNGQIYTYLLKGSGNEASTLLYVLSLSGIVLQTYSLEPSYLAHYYANGTFVGGLRGIFYSQDGQHFKEIYEFLSSIRPLWPTQPHSTLIHGSMLYELVYNVNTSPQRMMIVAVELGR